MHGSLFHSLPLEQQLATVRAGTDLAAGVVGRLGDDELTRTTLLAGWTRGHLLAHLTYNAAAVNRLLIWAKTGVETPMYSSADHRQSEIAEGAVLDGAQLRKMFEQNALLLDEAWAAMPSSAWSATVRTAQGRLVPASETLWMRNREVWVHAVDLDCGVDFEDIPEAVLYSLLVDTVGLWRKRGTGPGLELHPSDNKGIAVQSASASTTTVRGSLAAIVRWAVGRGTDGISLSGEAISPPAWL